MVKTHLPAHMDSVRQKCRPKHQLLILKCYPRLPKNSAADVKPNGSELSYLIYYASTRRSKLQKVGAFLQRKTASDVHRWQSARVLVTLQILTSLLENKVVGAGSAFALIAPYVLCIIQEILQNTNDISLIEASLATWDVFCQHQDQATLRADHDYRELYVQVVRKYASFARKEDNKTIGKSAHPIAIPDAIRLREVGLGAIKSVLVSDTLTSESGRQLDIAIPAILSNMRGGDDRYLEHLVRLNKRDDEEDKEKNVAWRRSSVAPVRTTTNVTDSAVDTDPRQAAGTASDADELAEEEIGVLALGCLKAVFSYENRMQVRSATSAVLKYVSALEHRPRTTHSEKAGSNAEKRESWATKVFELCTAWTPVHDRFIIMVTAVEVLVRLPLQEADIPQHLLFANLIDHILRSDLNLIGLSIMDILLGLIQQILRVLQLNGPRITGRSSATQVFSSDENLTHPSTAASGKPSEMAMPSEARIRLMERLKHCIADLATHVYYTDQISDMIAAILLRLKPNPAPTGHQNPLVTAAAIEEPEAAVNEVASNVSLPARERSTSMSGFFSFDRARQIALDTVREILCVANSSDSLSAGGVSESRNKVPIFIWEGTQWLLRDPAPEVRRAYVDALTTWSRLETKRVDFRIMDARPKSRKQDGANGTLARRAVSNASSKVRGQNRKATNTFLQLLHLAVYENALQFAAAASDPDILLLHLLLATLMSHLGVNAVQSSLPMIFALQNDITNLDSAMERVRVGSLVHGYFWALTEIFDFDASSTGREITNEVVRRRQLGLWVQDIKMPPQPLESISSSLDSTNGDSTSIAEEGLRTFDHLQALVDRISDSYSSFAASPPPSAPTSPGRNFSIPALDRSVSSHLSARQATVSAALPEKVREAMLEPWTREGCLAAVAAAAPKSVSLSGSRSSPSHALVAGNHRQLLAAVNNAPTRSTNLPPGQPQLQIDRRNQASGGRLQSRSPGRTGSMDTNEQGSSSAGAKGTLRVDDLKRVLADGGAMGPNAGTYGHFNDANEDTGSESLVDVDGEELGSESGDYATPPQRAESNAEVPSAHALETVPETARPRGNHSLQTPEQPPVLTLPSDAMTDGHLSTGAPPQQGHVTASNGDPDTRQRVPPPREGRASVKSKSGHAKRNVKALLAGIDAEPKSVGTTDDGVFPGMRRPPY